MMLFVKLMGVLVGVIALMVLVALISIQGVPQKMNLSEKRVSPPTVVTSTSSKPERVVVPFKTSNPATSASSSVSTPGALIVPQKVSPPKASTTPSVTAPPPALLKAAALNQQDIIILTNSERLQMGLSALTFNATLSLIAEVKAKDMIAKQYFAHVSPSGVDVANLAVEYGYQYKNIGENLALGDFDDSLDVVNGWMNSPGHRANILNTDFTEIGVVAIVGNYNGRSVWYSVQEFGRPMPKCPLPDTTLDQKITMYQSQIKTTESTLLQLKEEIDTPNIDEETYRAKVKDYNTTVLLYNDLVEAIKSFIALYNSQVGAYNTCVEKG
jgi:uncharacterized protein YkwD